MFLSFKEFTACVLVACLFVSCQKESRKRFTSVEVTPVYIDSVNVRALAPLDENRVWFGANFGKVGLIDNDTPKLAIIKYEDKLLHFRSIARTENAVFVLSIASPAVLYKIGFNDKKATNIEMVYHESGEGVFYDSMRFWNDQEGIAIGDPMDDCMAIIITRDGGNSWTKLSCDVVPKAEKGEVAFAASNSNIAVYDTHAWIATGGSNSRVYHTPDKGNTWEVYDTPIIKGGPMTGIFTIDFWDENRGIILGGDWKQQDNKVANKAITTDGGKTWKLVGENMEPGYRTSVRYVPGMDGLGVVAVGPPNGIYFSGNGGEAWDKISDDVFFAIEFVNDSIAFASGENKISKLVFKK